MKHVNKNKQDQSYFGGESVQQRYNQRDVVIRSGKNSHKTSQVKVRSERLNNNPKALAIGNSMGVAYTVNEDIVGEDKSKFNTSNELPSISTSK